MKRLIAAALAAAGLGAAGAAGLKVPARRPAGPPSRDRGRVVIPPDLPEPLRRHLDPWGRGTTPRIDTIEIWSRPWLRLGKMPFVRGQMRTRIETGRGFVNDIAVTWFGAKTLRVIDAFVAGQGLTQVGGRSAVGPEIDQAANHFLWSSGLLAPSLFATEPRLSAEAGGEDAVLLTIPFGAGTDSARLDFQDGVLSSYYALRHKQKGGPRIGWRVTYEGWHEEAGIMLPARISVAWDDDAGPWFVMDLEAFTANADLEGRLEDVATLIRGGKRQR